MIQVDVRVSIISIIYKPRMYWGDVMELRENLILWECHSPLLY